MSQQQVIRLKGNRSLIASFSLAKKRSRKWIVFLPEAHSEFRDGSRQELASIVGGPMAEKFNFLVVNKPGVEPGGIQRKIFEKSFRREKRIADALTTMKAVIPRHHKIYLVGYSEGAYLAPQVAERDRRVQAVAMIGGGTRGWLKEELCNAPSKEVPEYLRMIEEIYENPRSLKKWGSFTYATWYSYRGDNTLRSIKKLRIPMMAILGGRDKVIDLRTTIVDLTLISERKPIQIHIFGDCGHYFTKHWPQVCKVLGRFLSDQI